MKIKTADLTGPALDWAVAQCEGLNPNSDPKVRRQYVGYSGFAEANGFGCAIKHYSTSWDKGGPLIERKGINLFKHNKLSGSQPDTWCAHQVVPRPNLEGSFNSCALALDGPTPLIAAMRCYVASRLGVEVDVPDELV